MLVLEDLTFSVGVIGFDRPIDEVVWAWETSLVLVADGGGFTIAVDIVSARE